MTDETSDLEVEVEAFAHRLTGMLHDVLERDVALVSDVATFGSGFPRVTVYQADESGISLSIDGRPTFRLLVRYECIWSEQPSDSARKYLTVDSSSFTVLFDGRPEPLLHFDFLRRATAVPVSHLNVHAHRDEVVHAMLLATKKRGKARRKKVDNGSIATLSQLHIPLGGGRFRPSVEDVLQMMVLEFGIDAATDAIRIIGRSRAGYRSVQVAAAAADDPEAAAATLRNLGYVVTAPNTTERRRNDRLEQY